MLRVVKLGGSLIRAPELAHCLQGLSRANEDILLVPGGGPFADTVRTVQQTSGISDAAAHHMAMLAMEQYGLMLCALEPGLVPADNLKSIEKALSEGATPVWLPARMCRNSPDIPENWTVTSDSLAVWIAIKMAADNLTLIKQECHTNLDPDAMALSGYVDSAFPVFAQQFGGAIHVLDMQAATTTAPWIKQPA
ncbi:MAG TPA: aspartate/glutamate/uridylate kinase [Thiobacillus sp.]